MTRKLIVFFNIFANLATRSITFVKKKVCVVNDKASVKLNDFGDYVLIQNDTKYAGVNTDLTICSTWKCLRFFHIILF